MKKFTLIILILILTIIPTISNADVNVKPEWPQPVPMPASYEIYDYFYVLFTDYYAGNRCYVVTSTREMYFDSTDSKYRIEFQDGDFLGVYWFAKSETWYKDNIDSGEKEEGDYLSHGFSDAEVIWANKDIEYYDKSGYFFRRTDLEFIADVNIVLPMDGFMDTSPTFVFWTNTSFDRRLTNEEIQKLKINIFLDGERPSELGYFTNVNDNKIYHYDNYSENSLSFEIDIPYGEHYIEVVYEYEGDEIGRDGVMVERLVGFIDEDGDGLDDRTGQPYVPEKPVDPIVDIEKPEKPGEDGNAIDWLKYLGEYIGYIFEILINSISNFAKNVVSGIGSILGLAEPMFSFISQFFSSMPIEIRTAILAMFSVSVFLVIMKMIRG